MSEYKNAYRISSQSIKDIILKMIDINESKEQRHLVAILSNKKDEDVSMSDVLNIRKEGIVTCAKPKFPEVLSDYIFIYASNFETQGSQSDVWLVIDVISPVEWWDKSIDNGIRPLDICASISDVLNRIQVAGIGELSNPKTDIIDVDKNYMGYSMTFKAGAENGRPTL